MDSKIEIIEPLAESYVIGIIMKILPIDFDPTIEAEIQSCFDNSFKKWAKHEVAISKQIELESKIKGIFANPSQIETILQNDNELKEFYEIFSKELAKNSKASEYLKSLKDEKIQLSILNEIKELKESLIKSITRFNKTSEKFHLKIYPSSEIAVEELFVFPRLDYFPDFNSNNESTINTIDEILDVIQSNQVTLIQGAYGSGKTILAKRIQIELYRQGVYSYYFYAPDLDIYEDISRLENEFDISEDRVIIIDSLDELNRFDKQLNSLNNLLIDNFSKQLKPNHKLVITSRLFQNKVETTIEDYGLKMLDNGIEKFGVISVEYFSKPNIKEWLDSYFSIMLTNGIEKRFYPKDLKNWKKGLQRAVYNPLLLYSISDYYTKNEVYDIDSFFDIYHNFIAQTIRGKFSEEKKSGSQQIENIRQNYRKLIKSIAVHIGNFEVNNFDVKGHIESDIDNNKTNFYIPHDRLNNQIKKEITTFKEDIVGISHFDNISTGNVMNCYFFTFKNSEWSFKDNNILFYFLSEEYFEIIAEDFIKSYETDSPNSKYFSSISKVPLNYTVVSFLLERLNKSEVKEQVIIKLNDLIMNNKLNFIESDTQLRSLSVEQIRVDFLLSLIYLNLNFENENTNLSINQILLMLKLVAPFNYEFSELFKKFVCDISLNSVNINNAELNGFNFDRTNFNNVRILNSSLSNSRLIESSSKQLTFELCKIHDNEFDLIDSSMIFKNCFIEELTIKDPKRLEVEFYNCKIQNLTIRGRNKYDGPRIELKFYNCDLRRLKFNRGRYENIEIIESQYNTIDLKDSKVYNLEETKSICRARKKFNINPQTEMPNQD